MTILAITLTIAGVCALINIWLGLRITMLRVRLDALMGDGGHEAIAIRMRAHANFVEYAPFFLILLALVELARGSEAWLWIPAILFVMARIAHPFGMDRGDANALRALGTIVTWATLVGLALYAIAIPYLDRMDRGAATYALASAGLGTKLN